MNLQQAIVQSPDKTASNFGKRGWVKVTQKGEEYHVVTEDTPYPYTPSVYTGLEAVEKAVRLFDGEAWQPYELPFD
ncbi:MAG TPA: hypothetical protein VFA10_14285 [Ktedonobacteraceae bacterium]|nr:hypothetical protein [Ktedonobacteraceae bacterium]